jgi:hypothetical protein
VFDEKTMPATQWKTWTEPRISKPAQGSAVELRASAAHSKTLPPQNLTSQNANQTTSRRHRQVPISKDSFKKATMAMHVLRNFMCSAAEELGVDVQLATANAAAATPTHAQQIHDKARSSAAASAGAPASTAAGPRNTKAASTGGGIAVELQRLREENKRLAELVTVTEARASRLEGAVRGVNAPPPSLA